jgi:hypothetical protein
LRREIPLFLQDEISPDSTDLEQEMLNPTFLCELAFLTDITRHMNDLDMKLQGKQRQFPWSASNELQRPLKNGCLVMFANSPYTTAVQILWDVGWPKSCGSYRNAEENVRM